MRLHTASEGISYAKSLEQDSKAFYEFLEETFLEHADLFREFAMRNEKNWRDTQRAYYGVISDAIEGAYSFDLAPEEYALEIDTSNCRSLLEAVNVAIRAEEVIVEFYEEAAQQSHGLLADVPRVFRQMSKKHRKRIPELEALG